MYPSLRSRIAPNGQLDPADSDVVNIEDYERTLSPALIDYYERSGYCWVVTGSTAGRDARSPTRGGAARRSPTTARWQRDGTLSTRSRPTPRGERARWRSTSTGRFDYYPLAYAARARNDDLSAARRPLRATALPPRADAARPALACARGGAAGYPRPGTMDDLHRRPTACTSQRAIELAAQRHRAGRTQPARRAR